MAGYIPKTVGEMSLSKLLSSLNPLLDPEIYVFITLPLGTPPPRDVDIQMMFREKEGMTIIATKKTSKDLSYTFPCRMITLDVHSSLEAVGFMAAISEEMRLLKIGCNPVSGYYHDHIFVPEGSEDEAMEALLKLRDRGKRGRWKCEPFVGHVANDLQKADHFCHRYEWSTTEWKGEVTKQQETTNNWQQRLDYDAHGFKDTKQYNRLLEVIQTHYPLGNCREMEGERLQYK